MIIFRVIVYALAGFTIVGTFLPFIRTDQWWVRIFDFPRSQLLLLGLVLLALLAFTYRSARTIDLILAGGLLIAAIIQAWHIYPYTPIAKSQVKDAKDAREKITVFVANVLQDNHRSDDLLKEMEKSDPDIILLTETDQWWTDRLSDLERSHPHTILHPLDNTYGMNLYSRFPVIEPDVRMLTDKNIPSIRTKLELKSGRKILFYGVHPLPPGIKHPDLGIRQDSDQRDAELVVIAKEVDDLKVPIIIAGDFNDVAWSHTTRLFQRTSRLLDPRVGRGFYNSFNAKNHFFRYPLDHLFHSDHFTLIHMERMAFFGSDHFPIMVQLNLEPEAKKEQEAPEKKEGDEEEAQKMLERREQKQD